MVRRSVRTDHGLESLKQIVSEQIGRKMFQTRPMLCVALTIRVHEAGFGLQRRPSRRKLDIILSSKCRRWTVDSISLVTSRTIDRGQAV
eukprot:m.93771 g.93771  ORF g.93771 m.93771 type:complete len:89 (-) comp12179_c0_seq1:1767-2033(-)